MSLKHQTLASMVVLSAFAFLGCSCDCGTDEDPAAVAPAAEQGEHDGGSGEHDREGGEHSGEARGEHDRDGGEHGGESGEESGVEFSLAETYDNIRNGARLILAYDAESNSFIGTVENTTEETLDRVRVEVHLSNGTELGPTTPADLKPGEKMDVKLPATNKPFERWTAHPEVGSNEHGHGEEGGEHGGEVSGEHG